jgi:hypothetical protein
MDPCALPVTGGVATARAPAIRPGRRSSWLRSPRTPTRVRRGLFEQAGDAGGDLAVALRAATRGPTIASIVPDIFVPPIPHAFDHAPAAEHRSASHHASEGLRPIRSQGAGRFYVPRATFSPRLTRVKVARNQSPYFSLVLRPVDR